MLYPNENEKEGVLLVHLCKVAWLFHIVPVSHLVKVISYTAAAADLLFIVTRLMRHTGGEETEELVTTLSALAETCSHYRLVHK
jgi:hypothetical protein